MNEIKQYFHNLFSSKINYRYVAQMRDALLNKYNINIDLFGVYKLMIDDHMINRNGLPTKTAIKKGWID